jgi:hypothetical protein
MSNSPSHSPENAPKTCRASLESRHVPLDIQSCSTNHPRPNPPLPKNLLKINRRVAQVVGTPTTCVRQHKSRQLDDLLTVPTRFSSLHLSLLCTSELKTTSSPRLGGGVAFSKRVSRLLHRAELSRSQQKVFSRFPCFPRKTNQVPDCGSPCNCSRTRAASVSKLFRMSVGSRQR